MTNQTSRIAVRAPRASRMVRQAGLLAACALASASVSAQTTTYTWQQLKAKFEAVNPTLKAYAASIDENRAAEITAYLRPNPDFSLSIDGTQLTPYLGIYRPFAGTQVSPSISYLHERQHKRELRLAVAKATTAVSQSTYQDQERNLLFTLRNAYVEVLQAKAVLQNANENLAYWDRELAINRTRYNAGDLAQIDFNRLEAQRVQFESDYTNAIVSLRTAKIQLIQLLNERIAVDNFDLSGPFDFDETLNPLEQFRERALASRPDLKEAQQNVDLAKENYKLAVSNGSTDPTFSVWWTHNPSFNNPYDYNTVGVSVSIPLRIFDRNQGEKARTQIDIGRNVRLREAAEAQVYNDVDSAYYTLLDTVGLLKRYKTRYLILVADIRDRVAHAYQNGGESLLDYLDAEKSYRDTRLAYLNLIGSYMTAAAQMNMAVGQEAIQ